MTFIFKDSFVFRQKIPGSTPGYVAFQKESFSSGIVGYGLADEDMWIGSVQSG